MNAKKLIVALSLLAAGSAFADDMNYPYVKFDDFQSTKTRAEVMAELQQARADGSYVVGGNEYKAPDAHFVSTKTRAQVLAELQDAQRDGTYVVGGEAWVGQYSAPGTAKAKVSPT
jgi:hypothetical protein